MAKKPILESAVMNILWSTGGWLTPSEVRSRLPAEHAVAYTTVMTVLVRLHAKERLIRRKQGRAFAYRATETQEEFAAARMEQTLAMVTDRSSALGHFIGVLTPDERAEIREWLAER